MQDLSKASWINALVTSATVPLGLAYLASYVEEHGFRAKILDNNIEHLSRKRFSDYLKRVKPKAVGFSASTSIFAQVLDFASAVKEFDKGIIVIAGGPHPSALPKESLQNQAIDIVVKGEGEETLLELLFCLLRGKGSLSAINGIFYRENGGIKSNAKRDYIQHIDKLPLPAYHLLPMQKYRHSPFRRVTMKKSASIITSRGCVYNCSFCCNSVFGASVRYRSPDNVLKEVKYLIDEYAVKEIIFRDDAFTLDIERAREIARGIRNLKRDIKWSCYSRVNHASDGLYREFYDSGCREICFGVESGNQDVLDMAKKQINTDEIEKAIRLCRKYRISSLCSMIIGLPGDSLERVERSINFFKKANPDYMVFCVLVPMPGSELFNIATKEGLLNAEKIHYTDYVKVFSSSMPPISMCQIPRDQLAGLQKEAFRSFYLRPGYLMKKLGKCISPMFFCEFYQIGRGGYAFMRHQLHNFCLRRN
jgi:anaerobic magnesium-protoporphyrin IX monomethyl ester cyclase